MSFWRRRKERKAWKRKVQISVDHCRNWVEYKPERANYQQKPSETLERGTGDCEDFAALFWYELKQQSLFDDAAIFYGFDHKYKGGHAILQIKRGKDELWICCNRGVMNRMPRFDAEAVRSDYVLSMWVEAA